MSEKDRATFDDPNRVELPASHPLNKAMLRKVRERQGEPHCCNLLPPERR